MSVKAGESTFGNIVYEYAIKPSKETHRQHSCDQIKTPPNNC